MLFSERFLARDFLGGVLFATFGIATVMISAGYPIGSATRMGPGFFPLMIGGLIVLLGLTLAVHSLVISAPQPRLPAFALRPLFFIMAAVAAFALLIDTWGLVVAVAALVIVARLTKIDGSLREAGTTVAVLCAVAVLIFVYGLNMPLRVAPW